MSQPEKYYDILEEQFEEATQQCVFEILKVLTLDKIHSDKQLVAAVDYFNGKNGVVTGDAPTAFLSKEELQMVTRGDHFRPKLYCMLLSAKFAEGIQKKTLHIEHSYKYAFNAGSPNQ